ncbi:MAG: FMN-binding protein [Chloroflexi bacterium]|nr:FMN-binding protein [Chloroflexota bacterium]MCL5275032.1 FMN-binding protein [Chloroflexota bacterium]
MSKNQPVKKRSYAAMMRKYLISAFVVASFAVYALNENNSNPNTAGGVAPLQASTQASRQAPAATIYPTTAPEPALAPDATSTAQSAPANTALIGPVAPTKSAAQPTDAPQPTDTAAPPTDTPVPPAAVASGYKDGQFTGDVADAYYGAVQVKVAIQKGKIVNVQFLDYPHDRRRSADINSQAMPWLQQEAVQAQSAQVDIIGGATLTSQAFIESLQTALNSAKS